MDRFSAFFFRRQNREKICNNGVAKDPTASQVCRYATLWNVNVTTEIGLFDEVIRRTKSVPNFSATL